MDPANVKPEIVNKWISPEDFIVVPEVFGYVMEQIKNLPCGKIVLTQNYNHIVETLQPGGGLNNVILINGGKMS